MTLISYTEYVVFFLLGISFGSFISCVAYRLPRNQNIVLARSFCPMCKYKLKSIDLFPLISYLLLNGYCRYCKTKIPILYPIIEFITGLIFILLYYKFSISYKLVLLITFTTCLLIAILIDIEFYIIPTSMQIILLFVGFAYSSYVDCCVVKYLWSALILLFIALILKFSFSIALNKDALGWGDVKFLFISGLFIDPYSIPTFLMLSGVFGIITSIIWKIVYKKEIFPFIPALGTALFILILFFKF